MVRVPFCLVVLTLLTSSLAASPVTTPDRLAVIQARGEVIVILKNDKARAVDEHRDPAHREKRAFELRIAQAIVKHLLRSSAKMTLLVRHKPDRTGAIASGDADLGIAMLSPSPGARQVDFSRPYYHDGLALMSQPKRTITDAAQLRGKKILTLARDEYGQREEAKRITSALGEPLATTPVADFRTAASQIKAGEAVGLLSMGANIARFLSRHPGGLVSSPLLTHEQFAVAIPKDSPALAAAVNAVIEELERSGQLEAWREEAGLGRGE